MYKNNKVLNYASQRAFAASRITTVYIYRQLTTKRTNGSVKATTKSLCGAAIQEVSTRIAGNSALTSKAIVRHTRGNSGTVRGTQRVCADGCSSPRSVIPCSYGFSTSLSLWLESGKSQCPCTALRSLMCESGYVTRVIRWCYKNCREISLSKQLLLIWCASRCQRQTAVAAASAST